MTEAMMIRAAIKTAVLLLSGFGAALVLRKAPASIKHLAWTATLGACALTPLLEFGVPRIDPPVPVARYLVVDAAAAGPAVVPAHGAPRLDLSWIWIAGTIFFAARLAVSRVALARLLRRTESRGDYRVSHETSVPFLAGVFRPVIVLPAGSDRWDPATRAAVLLHERAHAERRDSLTMLLGQAVCALHWFQPLAWIAYRRLRSEQEAACDDWVLNRGLRPPDYAQHLLDVAKQAGERGFWRPAAVAMAGADLPERVAAILAGGRSRYPARRVHCTVAAAILAAISLPLAAMRPPDANAAVAGFVSDGTGGVANAEVSVLSVASNRIVNVKTGSDGRFRAEIPEGAYEIYVRASGFAVASLRGSVRAGETGTVQAVLRPGDLVERMEVRATRVSPGIADPGPHAARMGGRVTPARLIHSTPPVYPADAKDRGVSGDVLLRAVIRMDGSLASIQEVLSPSPLLTEAAKSCVSQWRYQPARLNGNPVEAVTTIKVQFELTEK